MAGNREQNPQRLQRIEHVAREDADAGNGRVESAGGEDAGDDDQVDDRQREEDAREPHGMPASRRGR